MQNLQQRSSENAFTDGIAAAARQMAAAGELPEAVAAAVAKAPAPQKQTTVVKDAWAKTPRNAPCPCGSGKKFKMCHGATQ